MTRLMHYSRTNAERPGQNSKKRRKSDLQQGRLCAGQLDGLQMAVSSSKNGGEDGVGGKELSVCCCKRARVSKVSGTNLGLTQAWRYPHPAAATRTTGSASKSSMKRGTVQPRVIDCFGFQIRDRQPGWALVTTRFTCSGYHHQFPPLQ